MFDSHSQVGYVMAKADGMRRRKIISEPMELFLTRTKSVRDPNLFHVLANQPVTALKTSDLIETHVQF